MIENLTLNFLVKKKIVFRNSMVTWNQQEKVASSLQVLLGIILQIQNIFQSYAELNRLWVGRSKFPFYELASRNGARAVKANFCAYNFCRTANSLKHFTYHCTANSSIL